MKTGDHNGLRPFGMRDNLAYAAGDFGCNMSFALKGTLVIFWTQFMGMNSLLYAALLLIVQVWDAINDPLIGAVVDADRRKYRLGKFKTYILVGSIGLIFSGALCFIPLPNASALAKNVLFIGGYVIWDAFYTVANVPYGAFLSRITSDPGERASLSTWRSIGALAGNILTMVLIPILIYDAGQNIVGTRVFLIALIMGVIGFVSFQFMLRNSVERVEDDVNVKEDAPKFNVLKAMGNFLKNRAAVGATLAAMGMFLGMQGGAAAVTVLFQSYFKNVQISGVVSLFAMLPMLIFVPIIRKMSTKYGKKEICVYGSLCSVAACLLMVVLPIQANTAGIAIYVVCQLVNSLGLGVYSCVSWSLMADAIDYNQWRFGVAEEGTVYSLHSFFRKLAQGLGPSLVLVIMVALGYVEANGGAQTAAVALNMRYLVAALYLFSAVVEFVSLTFIYNIDKKTLAKMNAELNTRHTAVKSAE
ncbi:MAG: glycoside-pentoside-hexuronide (GPH):cation symporter [Oscillospiraceae bacterium]|nr:glycoside-pentoside-hexuronide (GPH):cation symporter [Oscillospiraceae bacterium]